MTQQAEPIAQALRDAFTAYAKLDAQDTTRVPSRYSVDETHGADARCDRAQRAAGAK